MSDSMGNQQKSFAKTENEEQLTTTTTLRQTECSEEAKTSPVETRNETSIEASERPKIECAVETMNKTDSDNRADSKQSLDETRSDRVLRDEDSKAGVDRPSVNIRRYRRRVIGAELVTEEDWIASKLKSAGKDADKMSSAEISQFIETTCLELVQKTTEATEKERSEANKQNNTDNSEMCSSKELVTLNTDSSSQSTTKQSETERLDTNDEFVTLIERLDSKQANLIEPLATITKLVKQQAGGCEPTNQFIALLIQHEFVKTFEQYLTDHNIHAISQLEKVGKSTKYWPTVKRFLMLIWIVCDQCVNFCQQILSSALFHILLTDLQRLCVLNYSDSDLQTFTVKAVLGILHNICRNVPNGKWKLRNSGVVSIVRFYLQSNVPMIRLKSFVILSYVISEAENEMINSDDENFVFIFKVLSDALQSDSHKSSKYGMSVVEVMKGLNNLAINDENKIRIVRNRGLPLFQAILENGWSDEIKVTITTLWSLAFHHYNKVKMREMPVITAKLYELQQSRDEEICHAARGTFWELENVSKASIGSSLSSSLSADKDPSQPHIMISYQWDSQAVMMKVKDRLRQAGYKVWMDIEHMSGSTLEAMALAVEKAAVVLICMSQKYKDSPNCRTEAEYVYRLRKDFVPLRLQKEYIPDGWLGILVGTRLYFDVYSEAHLDDQVPRLTRELRDRGKISPSSDKPDSFRPAPQRLTSREAVPILHHPVSPTVANWTTHDVKQWMKSLGLIDFSNRFDDIDGLLLLELQKIQETAPEYFHCLLKNEFSLPVVAALTLSRSLRLLS